MLRNPNHMCFAFGFAAMLIAASIGAAGDLVTGGLLALGGVLSVYAFSVRSKLPRVGVTPGVRAVGARALKRP